MKENQPLLESELELAGEKDSSPLTESHFLQRNAPDVLTGFDAWLAASPDVPAQPGDALP